MWALYNQAAKWTTRPSEIVGIEGGWTAHDFDNAVYEFGAWVENRLKSVQLNDTERRATNSREVMERKMRFELEDALGIEKPPIVLSASDVFGRVSEMEGAQGIIKRRVIRKKRTG